jgi:hypothetical protein
MAKKDLLDRWADEANKDPKKLVALMFWRERHRNPEMAIQITEKDISGFQGCVDYLEVTPEVVIIRPQGRPAQAGQPARGRLKAVPARPAEPPRPFVAVNLVNAGTMDSFKPIENNEEDAKVRDQAELVRRAKDKASQLAAQLMHDAASGTFSTATMTEAAQALQALARA